MKLRYIIPFACLIFNFLVCFAQLPQTEIYLFDIKESRMGYTINNPTKIAVGNGYNNQPHFSRDGRYMYFVSNGKKGGKTDIYRYDIQKKRTKRLTKTKHESEYSPKITPDQKRLSCVRVPEDSTIQNLCTYNLKGKKGKVLFPENTTFGYYTWLTQIDVLSFHVPEPFTLMRHQSIRKIDDTIRTDIGRCMEKIRSNIVYVDKSDSNQWYLKILNPAWVNTRKEKSIAADVILSETLEGEEDFAFIRSNTLLMGREGVIYRKKNIFKNSNAQWEAVVDLSKFFITDFYRISVSPTHNKLAVVSYSGEKP